jgi:ribosomal protein S18 acetylase RimI-like enzyme
MRKTIEACRGKFEVIVLSVFSNNYHAKTLYEKLGFKMYGQLPRGIKRGDQYIDEELMYLSLT